MSVEAEGPALPNIVVVALFPKAGSNCGALLLDDSSFVGDCFCCPHIADELFYYYLRSGEQAEVSWFPYSPSIKPGLDLGTGTGTGTRGE